MTPLNDTRLRLLGPVGLYVFVSVFFRLELYLDLALRQLLTNAFIAITAGIFCWNLARWVVLRLQRQHPGLDNTRQRLMRLLAVFPLLVIIAWLIRHVIRFLISGTFEPYTTPVELSRNIGIQLFYQFIYIAIYEGWYIMQQWQRETIEANTLEKVSLQRQLTSLQHQVNPHFLFNSLNSLSSLINESPDQADAFLDELTAVFRYLLTASDHELVPLRDELAFIRSFGHLLQTRYANGIELEIAVKPPDESLLIPPLALHVLVENAVRYNKILPDKPLRIRIASVADQRLSVANTLQRKNLRVDTVRAGLTDLASRYQLLNQGELQIEEQADWFVVSLPLVSENRLTEVA
ncbi:Sensor protein lytS [Fibrisoma limi BUZ 3]|uniref:Sensor protein lytS n=1 Tax=Fibrisoma limi BUZ 3 TaxID=1185876 RepID=I2GDP4_9BACT|nr:histidine kinase [Fibrisoma limi]CCH52018.1 Sensor protein lytS [Fibrisoma limi BUZ 3]